MSLFSIPSHIQINFRISVDPVLTALLRQIVDQSDDRAAAAALSVQVRARTAALTAVLPLP